MTLSVSWPFGGTFQYCFCLKVELNGGCNLKLMSISQFPTCLLLFCYSLLQGSGGVTIKKTGQALIFGIYEEPLTPGQCNMIVERMGDYLVDQGL